MIKWAILGGVLGSTANGQWVVQELTTLPDGWPAQQVVLQLGDVDRDGRVDLVLGQRATAEFGVLYQDGSGAWPFQSLGLAGHDLWDVQVMDADLDGDLDIVTSGQDLGHMQDRLDWHANPGAAGVDWSSHRIFTPFDWVTYDLQTFQDGTFGRWLSVETQPQLSERFAGTYLPSPSGFVLGQTAPTPGSDAIAYLDLNGDGTSDYVHSSPGNAASGWSLRNLFAGQWDWLGPNPLPQGASGFPLAADVNQDGREDLLLLQANRLQILEAIGFMGFADPVDVPGYPGSSSLPWCQAVDVDGDGDRDLIVASGALAPIYWMQNHGQGGLAPAEILIDPGNLTSHGRPEWADMDFDGDLDAVFVSGGFPARAFWATNPTTFGQSTACPAQANSTGQVSTLTVTGSNKIALERTHLVCEGLPGGIAILFLVSQADSPGIMPLGSLGTLCLGGSIGRYNAPQQIGLSDASGRAQQHLNLGAIPTTSQPFAVMPGQTLYFQAWHRDMVSGQATSLFSPAQSVTFE